MLDGPSPYLWVFLAHFEQTQLVDLHMKLIGQRKLVPILVFELRKSLLGEDMMVCTASPTRDDTSNIRPRELSCHIGERSMKIGGSRIAM